MSVDPGTVQCCAADQPAAWVDCRGSNLTPTSAACQDAMEQYCDGKKFFDIQNNVKCNDFCASSIGAVFCKNVKASYCAEQAKNNKFGTDEQCKDFCAQNNCKEAIDAYCKGKNLDTPYCRSRCSSNYNCDINLKDYCSCAQDIGLTKDECSNVQKSDLCPCFQDPSVYQAYYDNFMAEAEKNNIVISEINALPYCSYPACSSSLFIPKERQTCPAQCFQNVFIDSEGNIVADKINISQNCSLTPRTSQALKCSLIYRPCPSGYLCNKDGKCDKTCAIDSDCSNNTTCQGIICLAPTDCTDSSQCKTSQTCQSGKCLPAPAPAPAECTDDSHCNAGKICQSGKCIVPTQCSDTLPCKTGQVCQSGVCKAIESQCSTNVPCPNGQICQEGKCVAAGCTDSSQCSRGQTCLFSKCRSIWVIYGPIIGGGIVFLLLFILILWTVMRNR